MLRNYSFREKSFCSGCLKKLICGQTLIGDIILMLMATLLMKNMSQSTSNADDNISDEKYVSINLIFHGRFNKWMD